MRAAMVGREAELATLSELLEHAGAGHRQLALVAGEPGIGKSRLLDEFARHAAAQGSDVAWGHCWEAGGAPAYWPWPELLRATLRVRAGPALAALEGHTPALAQLLPELADRTAVEKGQQGEDPDAARFRLFEAVAEFFRSAATRRPLVLLLDDLHVADQSSLLLLQFLSAESAPAHLLVVVAYRDIDLVLDVSSGDVIRDLARLPAATRLRLRGLSRDEVATLMELATSVAPSPGLADRLREQTDGNPLYVGEVARLLAAEGRLGAESGVERLMMPHDVRETVLRRLEHLSKETTELLATASVFGRDFRIDALGLVAGGQPLRALAEAETANLVSAVAERPAHLRFSHAVIAEALYDHLPTVTRLELHSRAAETLEQLYAEDVDSHLAELARHFCASVPVGDALKAVGYSLRAGDRAMELLAYEEGARLYTLALRTIEATGAGTGETRLQALLFLGDARARAGDSPTAKETFLTAAELARRTGDWRSLARAALGYGGRLVWFRAGTDTTIVPLLREALAAVPDEERELRSRLLARLSGALRDEPELDERDALSAEAVALAREVGDPSVIGYALSARFAAIWGPDGMEEIRAMADEMERVAQQSQDAERVTDAHFLQLVLALAAGRTDEMRRRVQGSAEAAESLHQPAQSWYVVLVESVLLLLAGDLVATEEGVEKARLAGRRAQGRDAESDWLLVMPLVRWEQGRLWELEDALRHGQERYRGYPIFRCYLALLHAEAGRRDVAARMVEEVVKGGPSTLHRDNGWLAAVTILAEVLALLDDADMAPALYDMLVPYEHLVGAGGGEAVTGSTHRPLGQLAALLGRYDDAERHFRCAIEIHDRMSAPVWLCHTEYDYARMLRRRAGDGDLENAQRLLRQSRDRAAAIGLRLIEARVAGALEESSAPAASGEAINALRRDGEYWVAAFEGREFRLRHSKGLEYLAVLLANPGVDVAAVDLVAKPGGHRRRQETIADGGTEGDTGVLLDDRARAEYRSRIEDLQAELDEAEEWGDQERTARARAEMDFLVDELAGAIGLAGRPRRTGSPAERARQSVRKAISSALGRIGAQDPALGRHLSVTVHTGYVCRYEPDPRAAMEWRM